MKQVISRLLILVAFLIPVVVFQNCGQVVQFDGGSQAGNGGLGNGDDVGDPQTLPGNNDDGTTICDPFSANSVCKPGEGLKGALYYLLADDTTSPRAKIGDIIVNGQKAQSQIVFSQLDVDSRSWETGFPGTGGMIMNNDGNPLVEWFAFDLQGILRLEPMSGATDYQFALFSDDGSTLTINDELVIDHDNQHSPTWKCAAAKVSLVPGDLNSIKVKYFQGPRTNIALRLMWRPWSHHGHSCDANGGFSAVPASVLFH